MCERIMISDIDKFIKDNYRTVDDMPGYVWFSHRHMQIVSIDTLRAAIARKVKEEKDDAHFND